MVRWMLDLGMPTRVGSTGGILIDKKSKANITDTQTATFDFGVIYYSYPGATYTTVPPFGMRQINNIARVLESASTVTGREGYLILESNEDIRAWASQIDNATADPSMELARSDSAARVLMPSSVSSSRFSTSLIVINTTAVDGQINLRIRDGAGTILASMMNRPIAGYGYLFFEDIHKSAGLNNAFGPIEIEALSGIRVMATERIASSERTSAYFEGVDADAAGRTVVLPYSVENTEFRTNLGINNLGTTTASVNVSLFAADGTLLAGTASAVSVAPHGLVQINNVLRYLLAGSSTASVTNRQGYLKLTSNSPIKAFATQIDNSTNDPSIENSVSSGNANLLLKSSANANFRSTLVIVNPNSSSASVEIKAREGSSANNGAVTGSRVITIPANGQFVSENILPEIGATSTFGPIELRSLTGVPIIAVSRVYGVTGNTSGFFNAQSLP
jgi:hypothetical protein